MVKFSQTYDLILSNIVLKGTIINQNIFILILQQAVQIRQTHQVVCMMASLGSLLQARKEWLIHVHLILADQGLMQVLVQIKSFQLKVQALGHQMIPLVQGQGFQCQVHNHNKEFLETKEEVGPVLLARCQIPIIPWVGIAQIAICH